MHVLTDLVESTLDKNLQACCPSAVSQKGLMVVLLWWQNFANPSQSDTFTSQNSSSQSIQILQTKRISALLMVSGQKKNVAETQFFLQILKKGWIHSTNSQSKCFGEQWGGRKPLNQVSQQISVYSSKFWEEEEQESVGVGGWNSHLILIVLAPSPCWNVIRKTWKQCARGEGLHWLTGSGDGHIEIPFCLCGATPSPWPVTSTSLCTAQLAPILARSPEGVWQGAGVTFVCSDNTNVTHPRCRWDSCPSPFTSSLPQLSHPRWVFHPFHLSSLTRFIHLSWERWKVLYNCSRGHLITLSGLIVP